MISWEAQGLPQILVCDALVFDISCRHVARTGRLLELEIVAEELTGHTAAAESYYYSECVYAA